MSVSPLMHKQNVHIHRMKYYLIKNEPIRPSTWMNLKMIMLSERNRTQRVHAVWSHWYEIPDKVFKTSERKFLKRWEYQTTWPASWEICMQVRKQQSELEWNNRLVPNWERSSQGCILSPCLFNLYEKYIMRNSGLEEAQAGIKIAGDISVTSDMQMTPPLRQKVKN